MLRLQRAGSHKPVRWSSIVGLLLVPVLVASGFLWATWRADDRLRTVEAAVVNLDEAVTIQGQIVPLGRQLTAALVDGKKEQNFTWVLSTEDNARSGLASGQYAAAVFIPKNFSAAATSYAGDAGKAEQATIEVQTSPVTGIADSVLGQVIANAAAKTLNQTLTKAYLDNIYLGFNTMGEQFGTMRDASAQLADGAGQLSDGITQAADGSAQLADGMGILADNGPALADGASQLSAGTAQLAGGLGQMKAQTAGLPSQGAQLASGVAQYTDGVAQYAGGVIQLAGGAEQLSTGIAQYADGVGQYTDAVNSLVNPVIAGIEAVEPYLPDLTRLLDWLEELGEDADELEAVGAELTTALGKLRNSAGPLAERASGLDAKLTAYRESMRALAQGKVGGNPVPCPAELKEVAGGCDGFYAGLAYAGKTAATGSGALAEAAGEMSDDAGELAGWLEDLRPYLDRLAAALENLLVDSPQLREELGRVVAQLKGLLAQVPSLKAQLVQFRDAGTQLKTGGAQLADGAAQLADGARQLSGEDDANSRSLITGGAQLADGTAQLATGLTALAGGIAQVSDGSAQLATGSAELASGVQAYTGGVGSAATGARQLADGLAKADDGSAALEDGLRQFADGLASGADQIPNYDESERQSLANVVASPVSTAGLDGVVTPGIAWASLLLVLALWLGALATYGVIQAVDCRTVMSSRPTWRLMARSLAPGAGIAAAQALALGLVGQLALGWTFPQAVGIAGLLVLAAGAFVVINHAAVAWFGGAGRLASVGVAVAGVAGVLTYALPSGFTAIRSLSPLTPAIEAIRVVMTGSAGLTSPLMALLGWLAVGLVASAAAVARRRKVPIGELVAG